jgi:hypothetical protein
MQRKNPGRDGMSVENISSFGENPVNVNRKKMRHRAKTPHGVSYDESPMEIC